MDLTDYILILDGFLYTPPLFLEILLIFESYHMFSIPEPNAVRSTEKTQYQEHSIEFQKFGFLVDGLSPVCHAV